MLATGVTLTRDLMLAGMNVRIAVDERVAPLVLTPFAHLPVATNAPVLAIRVESLEDRALVRDVPETGIVRTSDGGETITHLLPDCVAVYRRRERTIDARVLDTTVASWRRAKPLQLLLSVFCSDHGIDLVHAGVVSLHGKGILFAGTGGSGKSTASIASLLDGLDFLGDDCVGLRENGERFEAWSVFGSGCLDREHLARFPALRASRDASADPKQVLPLAELFTERTIPSTTIRAVVLPRVTSDDRVTIQAAPASEALLALAPSSILKRAVPAADTFARIARMVRAVPTYRMRMGPVGEIGPRVRDLLETIA